MSERYKRTAQSSSATPSGAAAILKALAKDVDSVDGVGRVNVDVSIVEVADD